MKFRLENEATDDQLECDVSPVVRGSDFHRVALSVFGPGGNDGAISLNPTAARALARVLQGFADVAEAFNDAARLHRAGSGD